MKIKTVAIRENLTAREVVAFIHNRHCSSVRLTDSLNDAISRAEFCKVHEESIAEDIRRVSKYQDLDQYVRNWKPYQKF